MRKNTIKQAEVVFRKIKKSIKDKEKELGVTFTTTYFEESIIDEGYSRISDVHVVGIRPCMRVDLEERLKTERYKHCTRYMEYLRLKEEFSE